MGGANGGRLRVARKERQGQNRLPGFILYDHHQGRIVVPALFSQLPDCALGMRKCRRNIRQVRTMRIIPDPVPSAYCEEVSRHQTSPTLRPVRTSSSVSLFPWTTGDRALM